MELRVKVVTEGILKELTKNNPNKNVVMSPASMNIVLNMAASGSAGKTLDQFLGSLGSETITELSSKSSSLMGLFDLNTAADPDPDYTDSEYSAPPELSLVNLMFVDQQYPLKPSFQEIVRDIYKTEPKRINFDQQEKVKNEVNSWAEEKRKGLMKGFLPPTSKLKGPLFFANALYFKAAWLDQFVASSTRDEDFHHLDGKTIRAPFMTQIEESMKMCGSFEDFKVIRLNYNTGRCYSNNFPRFCMDIILPERKNGLQDLLEKFNSDTKLLLQDFKLEDMLVTEMWIPKWKFSYGLDMVKLVKKLGLTMPFNYPDVDFTEAMDSPDADEIFISKMLHKACISVNEEGTEGASIVSCNENLGCSMYPPPEIQFVADHPFMFMIKEKGSGAVIFTGAVLNPLSDI
ncbi:serpin-ZX-like [Ziziphus jujuba]|uniref:Serpin-ZX-like n=1 Tax=Ziziphus jujuba TaxID=326968 RepID=A0A6P3YVY9_ZIZJJ|nr:serpin-ZX-like [Ziziphus jujuba]